MAAALLVLVASGCSSPAAPAETAPTPQAPAPAAPSPEPVPMCHPTALAATGAAATGTVDCTGEHGAETVYAGELTTAGLPAPGTPPYTAAWTECDKRASAHLGDDWRAARLRLGVVLPAAAEWTAGARWFRCDVEEVSLIGPDGKSVPRTDGLAGALEAPDAPLRLLCNRVDVDAKRRVINVPPVPCAEKHNGEFVGVWAATKAKYPTRTEDFVPLLDGCREKIAEYAKVPPDEWLKTRSDVIPVPATAAGWKAGDRGVRCYLYLNDRQVTGSLAGVGDRGLPVRGRT